MVSCGAAAAIPGRQRSMGKISGFDVVDGSVQGADSLFPISTSPADSMLLGRILPKRGLKMVGGGDFTARN